MPALPKENLPPELAESRAFVVRLERELAYVSDRYPALAKEVELANTAWNASPFYAATRSVEKVIIDVQGDRGRQSMQEMDKLIENESENAHQGTTIVDARKFLGRLAEQAKGDIEGDMVRGQLLSHYKPFLENPEKEMSQGYVKQVLHTEKNRAACEV